MLSWIFFEKKAKKHFSFLAIYDIIDIIYVSCIIRIYQERNSE